MNYKNDKPISLKHLVFTCLKGWRLILIFIVIGAVISCGFFFLQETKMHYPSKSTVTIHQNELNQNNTLIVQIESLADQKATLETYETLLDDALKLKDSLSADAKMDQIAQIAELSDKIFSLKTQAAETELSIASYLQQNEASSVASESIQLVAENKLDAVVSLLETRNVELIEAMQPTPDIKSLSDYIKYAILGVILGAVISLGYLIAKFIGGDKIDGDDTVKICYDVPVLANIHLSDEKPNTWIDRILKKGNGEHLKVDYDKEYKLLAAKFQSICPDGVNEILVCSSIDDPAVTRLCDEVSKFIGSQITVRPVGNPAFDADAAVVVKNAVVVVAEKLNCSKYKDINKVAEQLDLSNANILGFVMV